MRLLLILLTLFTQYSFALDDLEIVPGERIGQIYKGSTIDDFKKIFGSQNVIETNVPLGEGQTAKGYQINPDSPSIEMMVTFNEDNTKLSALITSPESKWTVLNKFSNGTKLQDLEALNGKPFKLYGFEWDYGGTVSSFEGGKLEQYSNNLTIRFKLTTFDKSTLGILGDNEFLSNNPNMINAKFKVSYILVSI
jgi:hypothetical protein